MTIESLEKRKLELQTQQAQLVANVNAIGGALQDCEYWINVLKNPVLEVPPSPAV